MGKYQEMKLIYVSKLKVVKSFNKVTNHILKACVVNAYNKKGPAPEPASVQKHGSVIVKPTEENFKEILRNYLNKNGGSFSVSETKSYLKGMYFDKTHRLLEEAENDGFIIEDDEMFSLAE